MGGHRNDGYRANSLALRLTNGSSCLQSIHRGHFDIHENHVIWLTDHRFNSLFAIVDTFPIVLVGRGATLFELMEPAIRQALETAPGDGQLTDVEIECFADERPLVREGCSIRALMALDKEVAGRRHTDEAAE